MSEPTRISHWRAHSWIIGILVLMMSLAAAPARSQVLYGSIVGIVTDSQRAIVPGATVTIVNKETNLTRETTTNEEGSYTLVNVLPGTYDVKVALQGFREVVRSNVPVTVGQLSRVDVTLEVGALSELVTVQSAAQLLQTETADVHTELKSTEITNLPLNQFRNYQALINLVPGAAPMFHQNAETDTPARSLTTYVNGQSSYINTTRTDGATNLNIWLPQHNMYISPAETVDTVNVSTNNFDAEQGMAGGAAITVITKSGTNQFKGSAFEFFNNEALNARPYYFGTDRKPDKLPVERNIFGGTLGGPLRKDRLFFFGSYEGYKQSRSLFTFFNVPDAALRAGDFSNARRADGALQVIYDPATGNPDGSGRQPFPNNIIPPDRIHPIARQLLALAPLPNTTGIGAGGFINNYQRDETRTTDRHNFDVKLNFNRTSAHQIWGKFAYMNAVVDDLTNYLGPDPNAEGDGGITKVYQFTTGHTWTLGSTVVLDSTFGFSRQDQDVLGPDFQAGFFGLDVLGLPGTNDPINRDPRYAGYPRFDIGTTDAPGTAGGATGFSILGNRDGWNPIFRDERTYSFATNLTKLAGAHEIRSGYMVNYLYLDHWQPESDNPRGRFNFTTRSTTALRGGTQTANFYNYYAAFLLGLPGTVSKSVQNELMTGREWQHALFVRDRWNVTPNLTLDLGLRWEYYPIMQRAGRGGLERLDLDTLEVILGGVGGNPKDVGLKPGKDNFAPRVGAVYRMNEETVFRTGYGVTYNPMAWSRPARGDLQYPVTIATNFFNVNTFLPYGSISDGIPIVAGPDTSSGRVPLPRAVNNQFTPEVGNIDRGTIQTWNLAIERRLPFNLGLETAYVGAKGDGGYAWLDINSPQVIGSGSAGRPYARLGHFNEVRLWGQRLKTRYHALQMSLNRPFTNGFLVKGAYTWSKAMGMANEDGRVSLDWNMDSQYHRNYARQGFDRPHNVQVGFVYEVPWHSNTGSRGIAKILASDWQLSGIFAAFSGTPFTVTANGNVLNTPSNLQTADQVGEIRKIGAIGGAGPYYDTSAWKQPEGVRFGTSGRNSVRGPGGINLDMAVFRTFPIGQTRRLELRVQASNVTNTPKFGNPDGNVNSASFMQITTTHNLYVERQVQLGLRFSF